MWVELGELRPVLRLLRQARLFTVVAVLTLGFAVGGTTAIYGFVRGILLRTLPYLDPEELVVISRSNAVQGFRNMLLIGTQLEALRERTTCFDVITGASYDEVNLSGGELPERVTAARVLDDLLPSLGLEPFLGRGFLPDEPEGSAILSHRLWMRRFGGSPTVLGETLRLDGRPVAIVGVLPEGVELPLRRADLLTPLPSETLREDPPSAFLSVFARLRGGASLLVAREEVAAVARQLEEEHPSPVKGWGLEVEELRQRVVGEVEPALWILQAAVALALVVACANFASLLLTRGTLRERELAVRRALGASRFRIGKLLLMESMSLSLLGGLLGIVLAHAATRFFLTLVPERVPRLEEVGVDSGVLLFALALTAVAGLVAGAPPALLLSRNDPESTLRASAATTASRKAGRVRDLLTVTEVACALTLLVGTGLLAKSLVRLLSVETGIESRGVLSVQLSFPKDRYPETAGRSALLERVLERFAALPGVDTVAAAGWTPMSGAWSKVQSSVEAPGGDATERNRWPLVLSVSPGFFRALGIPLREGRDFRPAEGSNGETVVIVNRRLAEGAWAGAIPLGRRIKFGGPGSENPWKEVIGVVEDSRLVGLSTEIEETMFLPMIPMQYPYPSVQILVRGGDPDAVVPSLRSALSELDADAPLDRVVTLDELAETQLSEPRFQLVVLGLFAALSLGLAALGVYGVVAQWSTSRRRELAIRLALGADRSAILGLVLRQGGVLVLIGLLAGLVVSASVVRYLEASLFQVSPSEPSVYWLATLLLTGIGVAASFLPARRASRADPSATLRAE